MANDYDDIDFESFLADSPASSTPCRPVPDFEDSKEHLRCQDFPVIRSVASTTASIAAVDDAVDINFEDWGINTSLTVLPPDSPSFTNCVDIPNLDGVICDEANTLFNDWGIDKSPTAHTVDEPPPDFAQFDFNHTLPAEVDHIIPEDHTIPGRCLGMGINYGEASLGSTSSDLGFETYNRSIELSPSPSFTTISELTHEAKIDFNEWTLDSAALVIGSPPKLELSNQVLASTELAEDEDFDFRRRRSLSASEFFPNASELTYESDIDFGGQILDSDVLDIEYPPGSELFNEVNSTQDLQIASTEVSKDDFIDFETWGACSIDAPDLIGIHPSPLTNQSDETIPLNYDHGKMFADWGYLPELDLVHDVPHPLGSSEPLSSPLNVSSVNELDNIVSDKPQPYHWDALSHSQVDPNDWFKESSDGNSHVSHNDSISAPICHNEEYAELDINFNDFGILASSGPLSNAIPIPTCLRTDNLDPPSPALIDTHFNSSDLGLPQETCSIPFKHYIQDKHSCRASTKTPLFENDIHDTAILGLCTQHPIGNSPCKLHSTMSFKSVFSQRHGDQVLNSIVKLGNMSLLRSQLLNDVWEVSEHHLGFFDDYYAIGSQINRTDTYDNTLELAGLTIQLLEDLLFRGNCVFSEGFGHLKHEHIILEFQNIVASGVNIVLSFAAADFVSSNAALKLLKLAYSSLLEIVVYRVLLDKS